MKKRSLAFKLVLGGVIVVLLPLAVVGIISVISSTDALEDLAQGQAKNIAGNMAALAHEVLSGELKMASEMSVTPGLVAATSKATAEGEAQAQQEIKLLEAWLVNVAKKLGDGYEGVLVADAAGKVIADDQGGKNKGLSLTERDYFKMAQQGKANISSPVRSKISGKPVVVAAAPVFSADNKFVGVIANLIKTDKLSGIVTATKVGQTGYPWMVDKTGLVVAHPTEKHILNLSLSQLKGMEAFMAKVVAGQSGVDTYIFEGVHKTAGFAPVPLTGWAVGFTQNTDEFMAAAYNIRNYTLLIAGIALVLTIVGVIFFARSITRPITAAVNQLNLGSDQVAAASNEVATAGQSLAEGTSEQAASIEETSASLEELTAMTKQNADNAGQADSLMKEVSSMATSASQSMAEMKKSMGEISESGQEISKIIKSIDEIAFQTNLLALNAAVEAARAGEAGAGFAVVADEVRNLAMRAAEAAKNTAQLIEGTIDKINHGTALVGKVDQDFSEVTNNSGKVAELVSEIAAASNEQSQGITQINIAVTEMDKVTQTTAASAEESAAAAEELSAQAEEIKGIATTLMAVIGGRQTGALSAQGPRRMQKAGTKALPAPLKRPPAKGQTIGGKSGQTSAEKVIPLEDDDFKDF